MRCRVFAAKDIATDEAHEFSRLAESFGAKLLLCDNLAEAETRSILHASSSRSAFKLPLGFNHADFRSHLKTQLAVQWTEICRSLGSAPSRVWIPVGSGTLLHTFRSLLAPTIEILGIGVNVLPEKDLRICSIRKLPNTSYATCPEAFETPARLPPPIPSNAFYDAKLWSWIEKSARPGDLVVARAKQPLQGNYQLRLAQNISWPIADTLVWLDPSLLIVLRRFFLRSFLRSIRGDLLWGHSKKTLRNNIFSKNSLLMWILSTHKKRTASYLKLLENPPAGVAVFRLRSEKQVSEFFRQLPR